MQNGVELLLQQLVVIVPRHFDRLVKRLREVHEITVNVFEVFVLAALSYLILLDKELLGVGLPGFIEGCLCKDLLGVGLIQVDVESIELPLQLLVLRFVLGELCSHLLDDFGL